MLTAANKRSPSLIKKLKFSFIKKADWYKSYWPANGA